jgi:putative heme-binding domain-containing protein
VDADLLRSVLAAKSPHARAAATHIVADERDYLPAALEILQVQVADPDPRVRVEALRGLSFFPTMDAVQSALTALDSPLDPWIEYTLEHTLIALEPAWTEAYQAGTLAAGNGAGNEFLARIVARRQPGLAAQEHLKVALNPDAPAEARHRAYASLETLRGNERNGQYVFQRVCSNCHKVRDTGFQFGPELTDAGRRLSRRELIESIIEPSKKVDQKYVTTTVITFEGKTETGFVAQKNESSLTLLTAEGKQKTIALGDIDETFETNQSSMPENLASTLAPEEFLDVIEYLTTLK